MTNQEIPYGYCHCGCGQKTRVAQRSDSRKGWVKGKPMRFISHHYGAPPVYASINDYFWNYCIPGDKEACWQWQGAKTKDGYGVMNYRGKMYYAHRTSWEIANNKPIPRGKFACHECDNPSCVNPNHIWPGGVLENSRDSVTKDRHARGERSGHAKLTAEDIAVIRQRAAAGERYYEIASDFGCKSSYIGQIIRSERWAHLP